MVLCEPNCNPYLYFKILSLEFGSWQDKDTAKLDLSGPLFLVYPVTVGKSDPVLVEVIEDLISVVVQGFNSSCTGDDEEDEMLFLGLLNVITDWLKSQKKKKILCKT